MRRTYKVVGTQNVFDKKPGTVFTAELDQKQEERLIRRGAIVRMPAPRAPKKEES